MVDPGVAQAVLRQLNRWYRRRAKPHGASDYFHRGTRMSYTGVYRGVTAGMAGFLLVIAAVLYFLPAVTEGKSLLMVCLLKLVSASFLALAIGLPLQAFRERVVVTDDGLLKSDLLGRETFMPWNKIATCQIKQDDNKVTFHDSARAKLAMSLAYDGWQDFLEVAARRMNPVLYREFRYTLANLDATAPVLAALKKWAGQWSSFGKAPR